MRGPLLIVAALLVAACGSTVIVGDHEDAQGSTSSAGGTATSVAAGPTSASGSGAGQQAGGGDADGCEDLVATCPASQPEVGSRCELCEGGLICLYGEECHWDKGASELYMRCRDGYWTEELAPCECEHTSDCGPGQVCLHTHTADSCQPHVCGDGAVSCDCLLITCGSWHACSISDGDAFCSPS